MENQKCKHLGLMGNSFRFTPGLDAVFGYDIAVNDIFKSLFTYGSVEQITCFYDPSNYQDSIIKKKYHSLCRRQQINVKLNLYSEFDFWRQSKFPGIDILHSASMEFMPLVYMREFFSEAKYPITYTIHGASYPDYINSFYLMKLLMPFRPYDSLICTSKAVRSAVREMLDNMNSLLRKHNGIDICYNGRLDVIPLGVNTDIFKPHDKIPVREEFNIPREAFVILWIGRFSAYDKADLYPLLRVYRRLREKNPGKELLLILAGHDRRNLPMLPAMKKYIKVLGINDGLRIMENNDMKSRHRLYSAADIFTSPIDNIQETFGLTPIEAMACGTPQVVSDWNGYKDTVVDGVTGFRIPTFWTQCDNDIRYAGMLPSDPDHRSGIHHLILSQSVAVDLDKYEKAIQTLIDNPLLKKQMAENSVRVAREKFSWPNIIKKYEDLWTELQQVRSRTGMIDMRDRLAFLQPLYCRAFSSYPTKFVEKDDIFALTGEGIQFLSGEVPLPRQYEIQDFLPEYQLAPKLLEFINSAGPRGVSLNEITTAFNIFNADTVGRSIMWLFKQGFLFMPGENR